MMLQNRDRDFDNLSGVVGNFASIAGDTSDELQCIAGELGHFGMVRLSSTALWASRSPSAQCIAKGNIRLRDVTGGGTLYDIGIYCINAARYLFQDEPIEVFAIAANKGEQRFSEVEEMASVILRFPNERVASFTCSFGAANVSTYQMVGTKGDLRLVPAYAWQGELKHYLTINGETQERTFADHDQLAAEFVYFSDCILQDKDPEPSGVEGLNDVRIIQALYDSIQTGQPVQVQTIQRPQHATSAQTIERPPLEEKPDLIHAAEPSAKS